MKEKKTSNQSDNIASADSILKKADSKSVSLTPPPLVFSSNTPVQMASDSSAARAEGDIEKKKKNTASDPSNSIVNTLAGEVLGEVEAITSSQKEEKKGDKWW